jgi:hypothetical protein
MTVTISALFDDHAAASEAVRNLEQAGLPSDDISIVSNNAEGWYDGDSTARPTHVRRVDRDHDGVDDRAEGAGAGAGAGAGIGAAVGGVAGLLAGLGLLAIPGIGPVVAAGWLASTAAVALAGGAAGGIIGALTQTGVSEDDAHVYAEGVRRGGTLVTAHVPDGDRGRYEGILSRSAIRVRERADAYRAGGWTRYDPAAPPYTAEEIRSERERLRTRSLV